MFCRQEEKRTFYSGPSSLDREKRVVCSWSGAYRLGSPTPTPQICLPGRRHPRRNPPPPAPMPGPARKPCSGYKLKEITGSGIFNAIGEDESDKIGSANPSSNNRTRIRMYQQAVAGISHISFTEEESISPKRPTTLPEVAKQRELSGTLESEDELKLKKQISDASPRSLVGMASLHRLLRSCRGLWLDMHRMLMTLGSLCPPTCARLSKFPILLED